MREQRRLAVDLDCLLLSRSALMLSILDKAFKGE
jgi:hypothetical protein